jgi:Protein of unknown function (DUF1573)
MKKMKKLISALVLILSVNGFMNAQEITIPNLDPDAPEIKFESEVVDYGEIEYGSNGERTFKFKNTGKSALIISAVNVECGCTTPKSWPKEPIGPGKTGEIVVSYDTKRPNPFEKRITVISNSKNPSTILKIKGKVKPQVAGK